MIELSAGFCDESQALYRLLANLEDDDFERQTRFKQWTIGEIITHLHTWNSAVEQALTDEPGFTHFLNDFMTSYKGGLPMRVYEKRWAAPLQGRALLEAWQRQALKTAGVCQLADPKRRMKWTGPDMGVRSSLTARLMETWAHGLAIYDLLGAERVDKDHIRNIAVLGIKTFGWTFSTHGQPLPAVLPHVRLYAPSGAIWTWHDASESDLIEGSATEFCQVVTQVRNIADTRLKVVGESATRWMSIAQCFAGPPEISPAPGTRFRETSAG
jgi:uncharacterized protein (TIGR03084 family)